jgi:hypothetical protein
LRPLSRLLTPSGAFPKSGPFPPPELPGFNSTTSLSATPHGPACPSRVAGCWLVPAPRGLPVLRERSYANVLASFTPAAGCGASVWLAAPRSLRCPVGHPTSRRSPFAWRVRYCDLHFRGLRATRRISLLGASDCSPRLPNVHFRSGPLARRVPKGPSSPRASAQSLPP